MVVNWPESLRATHARRQRERAELLLRSADAYERGAAGEEATAAVLRQLPVTEWTSFQDVRWQSRPLANVDHVVIAPVFIVPGMQLHRWLARRPTIWSDEQIERVYEAARRSTTWQPAS